MCFVFLFPLQPLCVIIISPSVRSNVRRISFDLSTNYFIAFVRSDRSVIHVPLPLQCTSALEPKICPVCQRGFDSTALVPDPLAKPMKWFHLVNHDQVQSTYSTWELGSVREWGYFMSVRYSLNSRSCHIHEQYMHD